MNENVQKNGLKFERRSVERDDQWGKRNSTGVVIASSMSFENIGHTIHDKVILEDISLTVEPGEVLCLLGPSGSGKTTLLRIAAGLIDGTTGAVKIDGRVVADDKTFVPPDKRGVGLVFQDYALFPHLTILQNVEFGLTALNRGDAKTQALRILSRVGLADRASQYPHVLSGGEQQRVALARALAPRPDCATSIREQTIELLRETRSTAIIVTHDAEEALRVGDHVALIDDGKLVQYGEAKDLYYRPKNLFAAGFFLGNQCYSVFFIKWCSHHNFWPKSM
ncbi:putative 2-aminoethylphosphonate import ATP-binding protein PhnT [Nymphon striatum]|nr:putative 2-aminoethylphosphonate import ATP-binding protein PhnT [Nymphon striatum]